MRRIGVALAVVGLFACSSSDDDPGDGATTKYEFGPYTVVPGEEIEDQCVQISLNNPEPIFINKVELTTGAGFHHSNWLWVPDHIFPGADGTYTCDDRGYSEAVGAVFGGVVFAQSTQAPHEIQQFPDGVAIQLPPNAKLVAQIHLLNASDRELTLTPDIQLTKIPQATVQTLLSGVAFQNQALGLPAKKDSRFTVECDIGTKYRELLGKAPDFKIYYALAHYHDLGTALTLEAVRGDGTAEAVFTTASKPGDVLGGPIDPLFDMTGYEKLRFSCDYFNPRDEVVRWGFGDQEMCVFLAFTDSPYNLAGGVNDRGPPLNETMVGEALHYSNPCDVYMTESNAR